MSEKKQPPARSLNAEYVAQYLRRHPDFFDDQEDLLAELRLPHGPAGTVSLVERQMSLLRARNGEMRQRLTQMMDVARDNDRLFEKTRRLVLDLLDASNLEDLVVAVDDSLRHDFQVPYVSLTLFSDVQLPVGRSVSLAEAQKAIGSLLAGLRTQCGVLRPHELVFLFGEEDAPAIGSAAVVSLNQHGILAIGSPDPQHYRSSLGTLFLGHLGEVLTRLLPRHAMPLRSVR